MFVEEFIHGKERGKGEKRSDNFPGMFKRFYFNMI